MVCIYCGGPLAVSNSRPQKSRNQIWRRRPCKTCQAIFTSTESIDLSQAISVAAGPENGSQAKPRLSASLEPFDRDRLFISLYESLRHRPAAISDARNLADTVTMLVQAAAEHGRVERRTIADIVLSTFQRFDAAAASHYAAFHAQK